MRGYANLAHRTMVPFIILHSITVKPDCLTLGEW